MTTDPGWWGGSEPRSAQPPSTSPTCRSAETARAATPSPCSIWTLPSPTTCCARSVPSTVCSGPSASPSRIRTARSEEHTSELQSPCNLVCRLLLEKKKSCERARGLICNREYVRYDTAQEQ